jgi:hypothetical protein
MSKEGLRNYRKKHPHQVRMTTEEFTAWKSFKEDTKERNNLLKDEAGAAGIDLKDIKHYWYKSEKFSMFAKNSSKTYLSILRLKESHLQTVIYLLLI